MIDYENTMKQDAWEFSEVSLLEEVIGDLTTER